MRSWFNRMMLSGSLGSPSSPSPPPSEVDFLVALVNSLDDSLEFRSFSRETGIGAAVGSSFDSTSVSYGFILPALPGYVMSGLVSGSDIQIAAFSADAEDGVALESTAPVVASTIQAPYVALDSTGRVLSLTRDGSDVVVSAHQLVDNVVESVGTPLSTSFGSIHAPSVGVIDDCLCTAYTVSKFDEFHLKSWSFDGSEFTPLHDLDLTSSAKASIQHAGNCYLALDGVTFDNLTVYSHTVADGFVERFTLSYSTIAPDYPYFGSLSYDKVTGKVWMTLYDELYESVVLVSFKINLTTNAASDIVVYSTFVDVFLAFSDILITAGDGYIGVNTWRVDGEDLIELNTVGEESFNFPCIFPLVGS